MASRVLAEPGTWSPMPGRQATIAAVGKSGTCPNMTHSPNSSTEFGVRGVPIEANRRCVPEALGQHLTDQRRNLPHVRAQM
jgi:hypothetical protein